MKLKLKYYSEEDGELCYPLQHFIDEDSEPVVLIEMSKDIGGDMWCTETLTFVEDYCGNGCKDYNPCNGKSGRCRSLKNGFIETGKKIILKNGIAIPMDKNDKIANDKNT